MRGDLWKIQAIHKTTMGSALEYGPTLFWLYSCTVQHTTVCANGATRHGNWQAR
jgi:hypothetical protein